MDITRSITISTECGYLVAWLNCLPMAVMVKHKPILNTGSHLSYPFLLEWQGELYMLPEAGASEK